MLFELRMILTVEFVVKILKGKFYEFHMYFVYTEIFIIGF
jgi:hypothetical protein